MAKYRPIDTRLWNDRKFLALSDEAKLLWVFLLTTPASSSIPGVVIGGRSALSEQLQWSPERFAQRFLEIRKAGLSVRAEGRVVWLPNALRYQPPHNPNMVRGWASHWDDIPEGELKIEMWEALKIACKGWSGLFTKLFPKPLAICSGNGSVNHSTQDQEQDQEQDQDQDQEQDLVIPASPQTARRRAPSGPHQMVVDQWDQRFAAAHGQRPTWTESKQHAAVKRLLKSHEATEVIRRMAIAFESPPDWPKQPWDFSTFASQFDKLVTPQRSLPTRTGRVEPKSAEEYPEGDIAL